MGVKQFIAILSLAGTLAWPSFSFAAMSSSNYKIQWDTLSVGGSDASTSSSYLLRDTLGSTAGDQSSSANYQNRAGYRGGVNDQVITFSLFTQSTTGKVPATSLVGTTVAVSDTSAYTVGDFAAVIQDLGASQVSTIGEVSSIVANTSITLDRLTDGGTAPVINNDNDYIVLLSGTSASFGALTTTSVATNIVGFNVTADVDSGYTVQAASNGLFTNGGSSISGVSDGSVTAGSSEYGARSSDASVAGSTFDSQDSAFTTSFQPVVNNTGHQFDDRSFLTLKVAASNALTTGTYMQTLSIVVSGNY